MATYAAYRHVELDKVGCGKRSIMKPPGGESRDIFGADFHGTPSHHRVLKPPGGGTSSLFAPSSDEIEKPRQSSTTDSPSSQSYASLVNGSETKTNGVNGKNGKDLIPDENLLETKSEKKDNEDLISINSSALSAEIRSLTIQEEKRQRDGNPVTGEGYDTPETQTPVPPRTRVPPGGYSSGLW